MLSLDHRCRIEFNLGLTLVRGNQQKIYRMTTIRRGRSNMLDAGHYIIGRYMAKNMAIAHTTDATTKSSLGCLVAPGPCSLETPAPAVGASP